MKRRLWRLAPHLYMELMNRVGNALRFGESLQSLSHFAIAGSFLFRRNLHEVPLDAHPPGPVALQHVVVGGVALLDRKAGPGECSRKKLESRFFGELLAQASGIEQ